MRDEPLPEVDEQNDIGIIVISDAKYSNQRALGFLARDSEYKTTEILLSLLPSSTWCSSTPLTTTRVSNYMIVQSHRTNKTNLYNDETFPSASGTSQPVITR